MEIVLAILASFWVWISSIFSFNDWTLMICKSSSDNYTCDENMKVERGFQSLQSCKKTGNILYELNKAVYECGRGCEWIDKSNLSCKTLCDRVGCTK